MRLEVVSKVSRLLDKIKENRAVKDATEGILQEEKKKEEVLCKACGKMVNKAEVVRNRYVCYECGAYFRVKTGNRLKMVLDPQSFEEWFAEEHGTNPLDFPGYVDKLTAVREKTGLKEAVTVGKGKIYGEDAVIGVCDARFMMGSMGHAVGEKIAGAVERATEEKLPVILFCCSGGARMQEGIVSLMQMAKTAAALKKHSDAGLLYISVLTDPTTGGVTASFAMLGDIILAEPGALIGFAGARVIEQTIGQKLPEGFQRAEFQLEHGFVDAIVERKDLKKRLYEILRMHKVSGYAKFDPATEVDGRPTELMRERAYNTKEKSAWEKVKMARKVDRLSAEDYINSIFTKFIEFHGDRYYQDDKAIIGGIARFHGMPVTVIAQAKGRTTKENIERNFGMPSPDGYRKALRLMKQAEKFNRPVICFVDTPGAFCGLEAEERGQGEAIARNLFEMSNLQVPILSVVIGEGGSGGALAMATSDEVWLLENSIYSILSPEGFASILWKDSSRAKEAAGVMKLTADRLLKAGIVERVIPEPENFNLETFTEVTDPMDDYISIFLKKYGAMTKEELTEKRYDRFRGM